MLKHLVSTNSDPGGDETQNALNDSTMEILQNHYGQGSQESHPRRRRKRISVVPGKAITSTMVSEELPTTSAKASTTVVLTATQIMLNSSEILQILQMIHLKISFVDYAIWLEMS